MEGVDGDVVAPRLDTDLVERRLVTDDRSATLTANDLWRPMKPDKITKLLLLTWVFITKLQRRIVRVWMTEGRVNKRAQGGTRNERVTEAMINFMRDFVLRQPFSTIADIQRALSVEVPETPITCVNNRWTYGKPTDHHQDRWQRQ